MHILHIRVLKLSSILLSLASTIAAAESQITLYGRINTSIEWQEQHISRQVSSTQTGDNLTQSYQQKFSGMSMRDNTSRFGLKGEESLGNGLSANFMIEQSFLSDVGGGGQLADRRAWVGLKHEKLGQILLGHAGTSCDLSPFCAQFEDTVRLNHDNGTTMMPYGTAYRYLDIAKPSGAYYNPDDTQQTWRSSSLGALYSTGFTTYFAFASGGNNITYLSPNMSGFSFGLRAGLTPDPLYGTNDSIRANDQDLGLGREQDNRLYDVTLSYQSANQNSFIGIGGQWLTGQGGNVGAGLSSATRQNHFYRTQLIASQRLFNFIQVSGVLGFGRDHWQQTLNTTNATTGVVNNRDLFNFLNQLTYAQIGARMPLSEHIDAGANLAWLQGRLSGNDYGVSLSDADNTRYQTKTNIYRAQALVGYRFSERTKAYAFVDWQKNVERTATRNQITDQGLNWKGNIKQTTLGIGLRHSF